jgi:3-hydroxybutyrate dehydrogenase
MSHGGRMAGKVAVVTGAARGLGAMLRAAFEREGAQVVAVDVAGGDCLAADVGTAEGNAAMVEAALGRHGRLDVLVLNAGVQHKSPLAGFPEEQWDRLNDVMVKGPFLALRAAWEPLRATQGSVVVISSTSGMRAEPLKSAYCAAKAGLLGLVRSAALEGGEVGVRVNAIAPGWMRTEMALTQVRELARRHGVDEAEATEMLLVQQPVKRFVELEEVAEAALFLAGDAASAITGVTLPVDLGLMAG